MKRILIATLLFILYTIASQAQDMAQTRRITPGEMALYAKMHDALYAALPQGYKDWRAVWHNGADFDEHWIFDPTKTPAYKDLIPINFGTADPYYMDVDVQFNMPEDQAEMLMVAALKSMHDMNDPKQVAAAIKMKDKAKVHITIACNTDVNTTGFIITHCAADPLVNLAIPVPTTLAVMGIHSDKCPFMEGGRPDIHEENYYDNAVIFLGAKVLSQHPVNHSDGQTGNAYIVSFDRTKLKSLIVQNIVVTIKGDQDDIRTAITMIDWQKLNALLNK